MCLLKKSKSIFKNYFRSGDNSLAQVLSFEAEIPPVYKRPSRDLQFDYVNTAKRANERPAFGHVSRSQPIRAQEAVRAAKEAEDEAHELLVSLVKLVSPEDLQEIEDLYLKR